MDLHNFMALEEEQKSNKIRIPSLGSLSKKIQEKKMQTQQLQIKQSGLIRRTSSNTLS